RAVGRGGAEAGPGAAADHRPGPAHSRHDTGGSVAAAGAPGARAPRAGAMRVRAGTALLFAGLVLAAGCTPGAPEAAYAPTPEHVAVVVTPWDLPSPDGASQPDLVAAPDGSLLLSWIEPDGDGHALRFARYRDDAWSAPQAIARGDDWFVNWADTPHIAATADGALWAHWLRKSGAAKYAYDIVLARSADDGATWSPPILVNEDGT